MYRSCIFCSADLGANETIEEFPVGRSLAFDGWKGRLWAVCPGCRRWNLAPIEERWEAVESAEKRFRDSRVRVHSENVGVARMPDGSRLIRVGEAVPLELATLRYGGALGRRRRRTMMGASMTIVGGMAVMVGGMPLVALGAVPAVVAGVGSQLVGNYLLMRHTLRPILRISAEESPTGEALVLRQQLAYHARVVESPAGEGLAVEVPVPLPPVRVEEGRVVRWVPPPPLRLEGRLANRFLERALTSANGWRAGRGRLEGALQRLEAQGGPEAFMRELGKGNGGIYPGWATNNAPVQTDPRGAWRRLVGSFRGERISGYRWKRPQPLAREDTLALEIAIHEEAERRALEGELAALEAAWREAEEIAAIADTLPDDPLDSLKTG